MAKKVRLSRKTVQIMVIAWIGVVVLVGVCVFAALLIALGSGANRLPDTASAAESTPATPVDQATPLPPADAEDQSEGEGSDPEAEPAAEPTTPPVQDKSFGYGIQVQVHKDTDRTLDMVEQLGMNWMKQQIRWKDLEPASGEANWDALNNIFDATSKRDAKVMVSVLAAPDWARSVTAEGKEGPPDDYQLYANYVGEMARRYSGKIHAIEIWNEMNIDREWYTAGGLSARAYVEMTALASQAIRAQDPNIIIISGALSPTGVNDGVTVIDDFIYMQQLIDAGLLDHVDCVGAHANGINLPPNVAYDAGFNDPSALFRGPFDNPHHSWSFYSTLRGYRDQIVAAGRDTPLCVTEFGWASVEGMQGNPRPGFEFAIDNSLEEQADNIIEAFGLMHEWDFVWLAFLFNLDYSPKAGGDTQDDSTLFSITTPQGSPRPAFDALRDMPKPQ